MKENIIVAGGINIDIKGFPFAKAIPGDSNPGRVSNAAGGVGRNIAENLARLGTRVRLCGAVGEDTQGRFILESCEKAESIPHSSFAAQGSQADAISLFSMKRESW